MVAEATTRTEAVLKENYHLLEKVRPHPRPHPNSLLCRQLAEALLEQEVLNYKDLVELLGPLPYHKPHHHTAELSDMW